MADKIKQRKGNTARLPFNTVDRKYVPFDIYGNTAGFGELINNAQRAEEAFSKSGLGQFAANASQKAQNIMSSPAFGKAMGALGTVKTLKNTFDYAKGLADTTNLDADIDSTRTFVTNAGSYNQLQDDTDSWEALNSVNKSDMRAHSTGQIIGNSLKNAGLAALQTKGGLISRAAAAASVLGAGALGAIKGNRDAGDLASLENAKIAEALLARNTAGLQQADKIGYNSYENAMLNGLVGAFGGALGTPFAYGGDMKFTGDFSNDVKKVDEGGTHEQNPLEGVPMGMDAQGVPNLVEEGEIIYNDYVFSNRLHPTEEMLKENMFKPKYKDWTYAKIAEDLSKESEERPNDPISKITLKNFMAKLQNLQEQTRAAKKEEEAKAQFESLDPESQAALVQNAEDTLVAQNTPQDEYQVQETPEIPQQQAQYSIPGEFGQYAYGGNIFDGFTSSVLYNRSYRAPGYNLKFIAENPYAESAWYDSYKGVYPSGNYLSRAISDKVMGLPIVDSSSKNKSETKESEKETAVKNERILTEMPAFAHTYYTDGITDVFNPHSGDETFPRMFGLRLGAAKKDTEEFIAPTFDDSIQTRSSSGYSGKTKTSVSIKEPMEDFQYQNLDVLNKIDPLAIPATADAKTRAALNIPTYTKTANQKEANSNYATWLRYAPVIGSALAVGNDLIGGNKPDYSAFNALMGEANRRNRVRFSPIGQYINYDPVDRNFYENTMANASQAAARNIMNTGLNRGSVQAGLLANAFNSGNLIGNNLLQMEQMNNAQRNQATTFNRATDQYNSEGDYKASLANAERDRQRASLIASAYQLRDAERARRDAAVSANLTNLFNNIGDIGRENMTFNMINNDRSQYYKILRDGVQQYKKDTQSAKNGGYLTIKNKTKKK